MEEGKLLDEVIEKTLNDLKTLSQGSKEYAQTVQALQALSTMKKETGDIGVKALEAQTKQFEAETNRQKAEAEAKKADVEETKAKTNWWATIFGVGKIAFMGWQTLYMFNRTYDFDEIGGFVSHRNVQMQMQKGADRFFRMFDRDGNK